MRVVNGLEISFRRSLPLLLNLDLNNLWCNSHFLSAVKKLSGLCLGIFAVIIHWSRLELVQNVLDDSSEEHPGKKKMVIENYFRKKIRNLNRGGRHSSSSQRPNRMSIKIGCSLCKLTWRSRLAVPFKNVLPPLRNCRSSANNSSLPI